MNSLNEIELHRVLRLKTEIYTESTLNDSFCKLYLTKHDLIITNSFLLDTIENTDTGNAVILNLDDFGSGEPKETWVDDVLLKANEFNYHRIIAIGGGATIDISKLCIFGDGRNTKAIFQDKEQLKKKRELIVLPTTCGTGSEVTSVSVVEFQDLNSKLGLQIDLLFPDKAILVSELLQTLPYKSFALTSIDALAHAVESLLSPKANPYTDMYASYAIEGILVKFKEVRKKNCLPDNMQQSLIYANMAGVAFSIAGCATMHALSFPLGSKYHLAHGEAVYSVFGSVLDYYVKNDICIDKLTHILTNVFGNTSEPIEDLLSLLNGIYECSNFKKMGITDKECDEMAENVYKHQQRLLVNSPKLLCSNDLKIIYKNCLKGGSIYDNSN